MTSNLLISTIKFVQKRSLSNSKFVQFRFIKLVKFNVEMVIFQTNSMVVIKSLDFLLSPPSELSAKFPSYINSSDRELWVNHSILKANKGWGFHYNDFVLTRPWTLVVFIPSCKPLMSSALPWTLLVSRWE